MPVGSVGKWLVLGTLVATLGAGGCKEDDGDDPTPDAGGGTPDSGGGGGTDSGASDGGAKDSGGGGGDSGGAMDAGVKCGSPAVECTGHTTGLGPVAPGCAKNWEDAEVCGISSMTVLMGAEPKFLEKNAPGVPSESCAKFYDSQETIPDGGTDSGTIGNGLINTTILNGAIMLQYPGCCTKLGFCSGDGKLGKSSTDRGVTWNDSDNGYGCMESIHFFRSLPPAAQKIPCDPTTGVIKLPASDAGTDAGSDGGSDAGASDAGADGGNS